MSKRFAEKQLTQENYDDDDEVIKPGVFTPATEASLKDRIIKKAKRSLPSSDTPPSAFAGFSGFGAIKSSPFMKNNSGTPFLKNNLDTPTANGLNDSFNMAAKSASSNSESDKDAEFYQNIKELNGSFLKWLQDHHSKSSYSNFTPVFKDYENHYKQLQEKYGKNKSENNGSSSITSQLKKNDTNNTIAPQVDPQLKFSFATKSSPQRNNDITAKKDTQSPFGFHLGTPTAKPAFPSSEGFSFGLNAKPTNSSTFSFNVAEAMAKQKENQDSKETTEDDDNYEPPKNDFQPVEEKDSIYSKRCKLFYKKDDDYVDKGVGILHLKRVDGKTQLLVRADTSLGNILLNIHLNSDLPASRAGKNNVLLVCIPNPPINPKESPKPTPMLIRVKTTAEADDLLDKINEYKF